MKNFKARLNRLENNRSAGPDGTTWPRDFGMRAARLALCRQDGIPDPDEEAAVGPALAALTANARQSLERPDPLEEAKKRIAAEHGLTLTPTS